MIGACNGRTPLWQQNLRRAREAFKNFVVRAVVLVVVFVVVMDVVLRAWLHVSMPRVRSLLRA